MGETMSNYKSHAELEFKAAGWVDENGKFKDEMQEAICKNVLAMLDIFADEGHSGSSAPYAINLFKKLASFKPIAPLTGEDWEWYDHGHCLQNKRCGAVFKQSDRFDGKPYYLDGKVFWEWATNPEIDDGKPFKSYFTSADSSVIIEFPWIPPENPEYVFVPTEQFPNEHL
jgi:hypothetical protein